MLKKSLLLLNKDIALELAQFRILPTMAVMSLLINLVFALVLGQTVSGALCAAILTITFLFCGIVAAERSFESETQNASADALRIMAGTDFIFWGKWAFVLVFLFLIEIWNCLVFTIIFNVNLYRYSAGILLFLTLFNIVFAAIGVVLSALVAQCRQKGFLLTVLIMPLLIVPVLALASGLKGLLSGLAISEISNWLKFLAGFDIIFLALTWLGFNKVLE